MINIINFKNCKGIKNIIRVDRRSILGNPFLMFSEDNREDVCNKYKEYFKLSLSNNKGFKKEVDHLVTIYKETNELNLGCWCYPKRCHAETIREYIYKNL